MYLHDDLSAGHGVVMHIGVEKGKTTGGKCRHLACVKVIAHSHLEGAFEHSDIFTKGMKVRRDALEWATTRGSRSGRTAWQFTQDLAGRLGRRIDE